MANRNWASGGKVYAMHVKPILLDCNFVVSSTDTGGLGITSLKGPCIQNVFMNTSATPGAGNTNPATPNVTVTNPNPAAGTIVVQFSDNYSKYFSGFNARVSPTSGSALKIDNSALTAGVAYVISTLGNSTTTQWHTLGVPAGVTPAVGVSFIAASVGAGANTSTSRVMTSAAAGTGVASIEQIGDSNLSIAPDPTSNQGYGAQMILQCRDYAGAIVAPAAGSVISLSFYLSDSSILIGGE